MTPKVGAKSESRMRCKVKQKQKLFKNFSQRSEHRVRFFLLSNSSRVLFFSSLSSVSCFCVAALKIFHFPLHALQKHFHNLLRGSVVVSTNRAISETSASDICNVAGKLCKTLKSKCKHTAKISSSSTQNRTKFTLAQI